MQTWINLKNTYASTGAIPLTQQSGRRSLFYDTATTHLPHKMATATEVDRMTSENDVNVAYA